MRLVDVDKLIETLNRLEIPFNADINNIIISQPTAFNVDKVVEQLEKSHFHIESTFDDDGYCNDDSEEVVNLNEAIEIIKRGGIDEERS